MSSDRFAENAFLQDHLRRGESIAIPLEDGEMLEIMLTETGVAFSFSPSATAYVAKIPHGRIPLLLKALRAAKPAPPQKLRLSATEEESFTVSSSES